MMEKEKINIEKEKITRKDFFRKILEYFTVSIFSILTYKFIAEKSSKKIKREFQKIKNEKLKNEISEFFQKTDLFIDLNQTINKDIKEYIETIEKEMSTMKRDKKLDASNELSDLKSQLEILNKLCNEFKNRLEKYLIQMKNSEIKTEEIEVDYKTQLLKLENENLKLLNLITDMIIKINEEFKEKKERQNI